MQRAQFLHLIPRPMLDELWLAVTRHSHYVGLLVPDIPLEETHAIRDTAGAAGLELVMLTTPTTPTERMHAIATASQGFVYLVSVTGGILPLFYLTSLEQGMFAAGPPCDFAVQH